MRGQAYVTVATNDEYAIGGVVLGESLRRTATARDLVILVTDDVSNYVRQLLADVYDHVYETTSLCSHDDVALSLLGRPELGVTYTKLHCWRLTQYAKCVFIDADAMVLQSCDELFDRTELSAVPDTGWPDCFNSGVFVFAPSLDTYAQLLLLATSRGSFDGGDQGLLNAYFGATWRADISRRLPFLYNVVAAASYTYLPAYRHYSSDIKIVHFLGADKPWSVPWHTSSGSVHPFHYEHQLPEMVEMWIELFCKKILGKMPEVASEEVRRSEWTTVERLLNRIRQPEAEPPPPLLADEHYSAQSFPVHHEVHQEQYHQHEAHHHEQPSFPVHHQEQQQPQLPVHHQEQHEVPVHHHHHHDEQYQPQFPVHREEQSQHETYPVPVQDHPGQFPVQDHIPEPQQQHDFQYEQHSIPFEQTEPEVEPADPHWEALLWHSVQSPWEPPSPPASDVYDEPTFHSDAPPAPPTFGWYSSHSGASEPRAPPSPPPPPPQPSSAVVATDADYETEPVDDEDAADGTLTPQPETEEQSMERMRSWEQGNMDFMGRDNFDHIWKLLSEKFTINEVDDNVEDDEVLATATAVDDESDVKSPEESNEGNDGVTSTDDVNTVDASSEDEVAVVGHVEGDFSGMRDWEEGRIDYDGRDRSDNIMKRLDLIFAGKLPVLLASNV